MYVIVVANPHVISVLLFVVLPTFKGELVSSEEHVRYRWLFDVF